jgi:chromosome segregation protein
MYLSKLDIFGFKSFAHKASFHFEDGITAIIGPNGCGKSNIVDAIRWVLGEQKPSLLRLDKMDNLIFNGTAVRKPLSMVEVSILIENTRNILPSLYTEVKITRRLYRSGDSEYLLNNRQVRLKDIVDLFADTGMGSDAYSVIELKMVEQILSDNAEERRRLFEEAAGIKKYKFRRKSAIRKLESTDRELIRLSDVISEIQKTVNSLSRQVGKARRYHQFKNDLRQKEIYIYHLRNKHYGLDLVPLQEENDQVRQTRQRLGKEVNQGETALEKLQVKAVDLEKVFREVSARLTLSDNKVREIQQQVQLDEQKIDSLQEHSRERQTEIEILEKRLIEFNEERETLERDLRQGQVALEKKENEYQEYTALQNAAELSLSDARQKFQEFRQKDAIHLQEMNQDREEFQKIKLEKENSKQQIEKQSHSISILEKELEQKEQKFTQTAKDLQRAHKNMDSITKEMSLLEKNMEDVEKKYRQLEDENHRLQGQLERDHSRREFLHNLIENYEGFSQGVQFVMSQKKNYKGLIDTLANMVHTEEEYRPALESFLEEIANYLVVEGVDTARQILSEVRQQGKGRLTLVPLNLLNGRVDAGPEIKGIKGEFKYLKDVVQYDSHFNKLFDFLLNRVILVNDIDTALRYHRKDPSFKFLTREGDLVGEWGNLTGGNSQPSINLTGRKVQFESASKRVKSSERQLKDINQKIERNRTQYEQQKLRHKEVGLQQQEQSLKVTDVEKQRDQEKYETELMRERILDYRNEMNTFKDQLVKINQREDELSPIIEKADLQIQKTRDEEAKLSSELEKADKIFRQRSKDSQDKQISVLNQQNSVRELSQRIEFLRQSGQETEQRIEIAKQEITGYADSVQSLEKSIKSAQEELEGLYGQRDEIEKEKLEVENKYQALKSMILSREEEIKKLHRRWNQSLERLKELELKLQEIEIKQKTQQEQFEEQYGSELEAILTENPLPENLDIQQIQENVAELRQKIENLGEVNPLAVKEYEKEKERLDFLKTQQTDLLKAKGELLETIGKLNKTARELFLNTFNQINYNFRSVFGKFFEGGQAELQLLDNEDPLETNIDISVQIKGRKLTTLHLLSAGEKTLTAISLLFAIYLYKPSPFCILDEVDAPLDDVNISRYTHALREFSDNTQFILVTHNKMTMQAAQAMYGVTMEEPGISKVVSVRFD